ncbi:hypothetical protein KAR91_42785 [Candidatus Pacearchaeota archaeon]|nr:hypothetical protein [Candidatus Pacearchaeota archaeon]
MKKEQLEKMYSKKSLTELVKIANSHKANRDNHDEQFIMVLFYLEFSKRFREDPTYKNSSFFVFIKDKFMLLHNTYLQKRISYATFPEESRKYGPGLVTSVKKQCGAMKMKKVLGEIKAKNGDLKKPITREAIDKIIEKHMIPREKEVDATNTVTFWRQKYEREHNLRLEAEKELKEVKEQLGKAQIAASNWLDLSSHVKNIELQQ